MTGATDGPMPVGSAATICTIVLDIIEHKFEDLALCFSPSAQ
jgi:hypothetical protein